MSDRPATTPALPIAPATLAWRWADPVIGLGLAPVALRAAWRGEDCR